MALPEHLKQLFHQSPGLMVVFLVLVGFLVYRMGVVILTSLQTESDEPRSSARDETPEE